MNQHLKTIQEFLQQNKTLSDADKEALLKTIADADKQWSIFHRVTNLRKFGNPYK